MKITQKVAFNIASKASYVYILSGQKLIKNTKKGPFWRVFWKPEACGQTVLPDRSFLIRQKLVENSNATLWVIFKQCAEVTYQIPTQFSCFLLQTNSNGAEDKEELLEEDFMDADHKLQDIQPDINLEEASELPNYSTQTGMRFRLTSRTRSVMGLLEKMFENDLEKIGNKTSSIS